MKIDWQDKTKLEEVVLKSRSVADVCRSLGISPAGRNFGTVKKWLAHHAISTEHFDPITHRMIQHNQARRRTHDDVFCEHSDVTQKVLRTAVLRDAVLQYMCTECGLAGIWNDKPIVLQLDHINGIRNDNRKSNLRWLCPNCHSQTHTYCGRNNRGIAKLV